MPGRYLEVDFPGLRIGVAEYDDGPTGCTVFHFGREAALATDVRGGSPGVIGNFERATAICFAGGSLYGLEAVCGVASGLLEARGNTVGWADIELVAGAIVFDFGRRGNAVYPDAALGREALRNARDARFPLGARGAGRCVSVGKTFDHAHAEPAGQGAAFRRIGDTRVAVFTVVNAFGAVFDRDGRVVRGHLPQAGERLPLLDEIERRVAAGEPPRTPPGNTTLTLVLTNEQLDVRSHRQLAAQVHASMARAIQPFHALVDGDVLFAATTNEVQNPSLDATALGVLASELAWDAVLSAFD